MITKDDFPSRLDEKRVATNAAISPPRRDVHERRADIIGVAQRLFVRHGDMSIGLRAIAAEAGVTTGAIYSVFRDREEIISEIGKKTSVDLMVFVRQRAKRAKTPREALISLCLSTLEFFIERPTDTMIFLYIIERGRRLNADGGEAGGLPHEAGIRAVIETLMQQINEAKGVFESAEDSRRNAQLLGAALTGLVLSAHAGDLACPGDELSGLVERLVDMHTG